jgi:hypothetical protein
MAWEQKEGSGSLFKAEQKSEKAPGYRGDIMLGGVVYEIAAWVKEGKNGKFFSLSGKQKENVNRSQGYKSQAGDEKEELSDDSIPF